MKKVLLVVMIFAMSSFAQIGMDFGLETAMPIGDAADWTNLGVGGTVKVSYPMNEQFDITGRVGYIWWAPGEMDMGLFGTYTFNYYHVPMMAGVRYKMTPEFYGMAEAGMTMFGGSVDVEIGGTTTSADFDSETEFGFGIGAGYIMDKFDFSVTYNSVNEWNQIGLRIGYKFM